MCDLNILLKTNNKNVVGFLQSATTLSFNIHDDGEGFYCDDGDLIIKQKEKIDYSLYAEKLNNSKFILSHCRTATSGKTDEYTHPFFNEEFILIMNGITSTYADEKNSDTANIFKTFITLFSVAEGKTRTEKIKNIIKLIFDDLSGYFSIAIFDKVERRLYYFKDDVATINVFKGKDFLYLTTREDNKEFLSFIGEEYTELTATPLKIYSFDIDNEIKIKTIGEIVAHVKKIENIVFEEKKPKFKKNNRFKSFYNKEKRKADIKHHQKKQYEFYFDGLGYQTILKRKNPTTCGICLKNSTFNFWVEGCLRVCNSCLREEFYKPNNRYYHEDILRNGVYYDC